MTDVQARILQDFADENIRTRHTRSSLQEWEAERNGLLMTGWLEEYDGALMSGGQAHRITDAGREALKQKGTGR